MKRRILSLVTAAALLITSVPMLSSAAEIEPKGFDLKDATAYNAASLKDEFISENVSGKRLSLNADAASGKWVVAAFNDTAADIDAEGASPMTQADYDEFAKKSNEWSSVEVPSNLMRNDNFTKAHRVWFKTTVDVPANEVNNGFYLDFDGTNYVTTVVVNGKVVATNQTARMAWEADLTGNIKAGKNEIMVGMKSPRYGIDVKGTLSRTDSETLKGMTKLSDYFEFDWYGTSAFKTDEENLRSLLYLDTIYPTSKGDSVGDHFGITDRVYLVTTKGDTYIDDIFAKPTVVDKATWEPTNKKLTAEITVKNPSGAAKTVKVNAKAVLRDNNDASKDIDLKSIDVTFAKDEFTKVVTLTADAPNAELWWPDVTKQKMYDLVAEIDGGDVYKQPFGFRDVNIDGIHFRINGEKRKFWNALAGLSGKNEAEVIEHFKAGNNRFERMGCELINNSLPETEAALGHKPNFSQQIDWLDKNGIPVRLSTMIDGMFASFAIMIDGEPNVTMWENFKRYLEAFTVAHRNHPSIVMYSLENEFIFINAALLYGSFCDRIEEDAQKYFFEPVNALDDTKPSSLDGGGNGLNNDQVIYNSHYQEDTDITVNDKPLTELTPMHGRWAYDGKVPYVGGEIAFYSGENKEHSWLGGDNTPNGRSEALAAYTKYVKWTYNRFRYNDAAMTCVWVAQDSTKAAHSSINEIAVIPRDYSTNFFASKGKKIDAKIFNDTFSYHKDPKPITFTWKLVIDGKAVQEGSVTETIEAGESKATEIDIKPIDGITARKDATLELRATMDGAKSFVEDIEMAVFPANSKLSVKRKVYGYKLNSDEAAALKEMGISFTKTKEKVRATTTKYQIKKSKKSKKWITVNKKKYKKTNKKLRRTKTVNKVKKIYQIKKSKKSKKWITVNKKKYNKAKKNLRRIKKEKVYKAWKLSASNYKSVLKSSTGILLVGSKKIKTPNAGEGEYAAIAKFARKGGRVVILEQNDDTMITADTPTDPLQLPEEILVPGAVAQGQYNFAQAFDTPMLEGLKLHDLSFWQGATRTTSCLWVKPGGSVKSWIYAGSPNSTKEALNFASLIEVPAEKGVVLATQMNVGETLAVEPAANVLLKNMIRRADTFELSTGVLAVLDNSPAELKNVVKKSNVQNKEFATSAIGTPLSSPETYPMLIVEATEANLDLLNSNKALCEEYTANGGWIMLWGLVPDADKVDKWGYPADGQDINASKTLAKYNELLGTKHVMRPFRVEATKAGGDYYDKIAMGLSTQNVFLKNKLIIAPWINLADVSKQTFTYAVDATDNIAPFHSFEADGEGVKGPQFKAVLDPVTKKRDISQIPGEIGRDRNNGNMVDDLYNEDFWYYLRQIWLGYDRESAEAEMSRTPIANWKFPTEDEIDRVVIFNNDNYGWYTKIKVAASLNGTEAKVVENETPSTGDTTFKFENTKANEILIHGTELELGKLAGEVNVMAGVDEIKVFRKTPQWAIDAGVKSLTSNGTIVKYARGNAETGGGYLLNNVKLANYYDYLDNPDKQMTDGQQDNGLKGTMEPVYGNEQSKIQIFTIFFQNAGCKFAD